MKHYLLMPILFFSAFNLAAQGVIYECAESPKRGKGENANSLTLCKKVESANASKANAAATATNTARPVSTITSPNDFPRISEATQKARDSDRKQILLDELHSEEKKLSNLLREYNSGAPERRGEEKNYKQYEERTLALKDEAARTGKNVEALKRELAKLN
jgi:hypothetical protein